MKLFEPIRIGPIELKNRIVMAPMATHFADETGGATSRMEAYYAERARGGCGLIIIESGYIHPLGRGNARRLGLHDDRLIPGLRNLVNRIHAEGARVSSQLHHAGRQTNLNATGGLYPVSASSIPAGMEAIVPRTLRIGEIEDLVEAFGQAARRSVAAGFDFILIHAAHGYLIHQFLSPLSNRRKDRYGGTFSRRLRFLGEVVHRCLEAAGKDHPLMVRISADEFVPGGITLRDAQKIARRLEEWGVKAIHVSGGTHDTQEMELQPMAIPRGCLVHLAEGVKKAVGVPVATVGRITDPVMAEEILASKRADLITLGRALIADPEFPRKAFEGRPEEIRPCIACLQGCRDNLYQGIPITCMVNPQAGLECEKKIEAANTKKKVLIIGGGPGGMEAARVAALRGHDVTLAERNDLLGGQFRLASLLPGKEEIRFFLWYLESELKKLGVKIILGEEITAEKIFRLSPEVVILAAGGTSVRPGIPGVNLENVVTAWELLSDPGKCGRDALVVGGGAVGAGTAEFLAGRGHEVTLIEMAKEIALDEERINRKLLLRRIGEKGVKVRVMTLARAITGSGVEADIGGRTVQLPADTVVLATGVEANRSLQDSLKEKNVEFYPVGDCVTPRKAIDAIREGFEAALRI